MTTDHRLLVRRAMATHEGITTGNGGMLAIELDEPRERFLVTHEHGDEAQILSVHDSMQAAIAACKRIEDRLEQLDRGALQ